MKIDIAAIRVAKRISPVVLVFALLGVFSSNPLLTLAGLAVLPTLILLLWREGEPQVLLFAITYQWLQVFSSIVGANLAGKVIGTDIQVPEMGEAAWLGLIGIVFLAIGAHLGAGRTQLLTSARSFEGQIERVSVQRLLIAYFLVAILAKLMLSLGNRYPVVFSLANVIADFEMAFLFLILWGGVREKRFAAIAFMIIFFNVLVGFGGYFSSFKTVLFLALIVYLSRPSFRIRLFNPLLVIAMLGILLLGSFWQVVKPDYRLLLNQGTGQQVVLVSAGQQYKFIVERFERFTLSDLFIGLESAFGRLQYLEYFGRAVKNVPAHVPYQDGRLLWEVVPHIFMPRIFFPDKKAIDASARTNEFAGLSVMDRSQGVSIGIGYFGESYIDFGPILMFIPVFLFGVFWGFGYRLLVQASSVPLMGLAFATIFILANSAAFEAINVGIIGGGLTRFLTFSLALYFLSNLIWRFICKTSRSSRVKETFLTRGLLFNRIRQAEQRDSEL